MRSSSQASNTISEGSSKNGNHEQSLQVHISTEASNTHIPIGESGNI